MEHGQQAEGNSRWTRIDVDPEWDPGQDDDEDRWNVDLNEEVTDVATEYETNLKTGEWTWVKLHATCPACNKWIFDANIGLLVLMLVIATHILVARRRFQKCRLRYLLKTHIILDYFIYIYYFLV